MSIVQTLSKSSFIDAFKQSSRKDQFSYEALEAIFEYMEEYSANTGEAIELDIVAICCDFCEQSWQAIASDYSIEVDENENEEEQKQQVYDYLSNETAVVGETADGFVYQCF
jgi:predicted ArsR family transcriptional regulator